MPLSAGKGFWEEEVSELECVHRQLWWGSKVRDELVHCAALGIQIPGRLSDTRVVQMAVPALAPTCPQPLSTGACGLWGST